MITIPIVRAVHAAIVGSRKRHSASRKLWFIVESARQGIVIFRIFDSLNWLPNMKVAVEAARKTNRICEAAICYTGDILDPKRDKYPLEYYTKMARELEKMGAHVIGIKDMAGLLKPYAATKLIKALREATDLPIHFHTHDTSGINAASILKAADAGVHAADAAISSMSGTLVRRDLPMCWCRCSKT